MLLFMINFKRQCLEILHEYLNDLLKSGSLSKTRKPGQLCRRWKLWPATAFLQKIISGPWIWTLWKLDHQEVLNKHLISFLLGIPTSSTFGCTSLSSLIWNPVIVKDDCNLSDVQHSKTDLDFTNSDQLHTLLLTLNICLKNLTYRVCF